MVRTQISLSAMERALLDAQMAQTGRSMAALIRDAIVATYGRGGDVDADLAALESTAGTWERGEDGEAYVERLRSGRRLA